MRITFDLDGGDEDIAVDKIQICGTEVVVPADPCFYTESFETDGNGTRYTTSTAEFTDGNEDYFTRTDGTNINGGNNHNNPDGSFYFAAHDIDGEGASPLQTLEIIGIDISGKENLEFKALFAEDDDGSNEDWDLEDSVIVAVQIDGGGFVNILRFESVPDGDAFNAVPALDTDFDGNGDGTELTEDFSEFIASIAGTGTSLDVRITFDLDGGDEDIAVDYIQICGTDAVVVDPCVLTESFETDGNGTRYTTSTAEFTDGSEDYFTRTDGTNINGGNNHNNPDGSFYFAAHDIDGEGASPLQTLEIIGIDISGKENLEFKALFAEDDDGSNEDWDLEDSVIVAVQIDGGGFVNILRFESVPDGDAFNAVPALDTDFDGNGDGTELTEDFSEFIAAIPGTGNTLDIRITFDLDGGDEDIAIDNIQVCESDVTTDTDPPTLLALSPMDDATDVPVDTSLVIQFSEPIDTGMCGASSIQLFDTSSTTPIEEFDICTSTQLTISGDSLIIEPSRDLDSGTIYYVLIADDAIVDTAGNAFVGISDTTTWSFSTPIKFDPIVPPYMQMVEDENQLQEEGWRFVSVDADQAETWYVRTIDDNSFFEASAFEGTAPGEDWLISPPFDLEQTTDEVLSFEFASGFDDLGVDSLLSVFYTLDYTGDPSTTDWIVLEGFELSEIRDNVFRPSGFADINDIVGTNVVFAWRYKSSGTTNGSTTRVRVDNISIKTFDAFAKTDPLICIGDEVKIVVGIAGGQAPYTVRIATEINGDTTTFTTSESVDTFSLFLATSNDPDLEAAYTLVDVSDVNGSTIIKNQTIAATTVNCTGLINDFFPEDPCSCIDDQSANGAQDGGFLETVSIRVQSSGSLTFTITDMSPVGGPGTTPSEIPSLPTIAITEFIADATGSDADGEFIELFNFGPVPVSLDGWTISDEDSDAFTIAGVVIPSGGYAVFTQNKARFDTIWFGGESQPFVYEYDGIAIGNSSDELVLSDETNTVVWSLAYANDETTGFSTYLTAEDPSSIPSVFGSKGSPGVDRDGDDLAMGGFLGYEKNNATPDTLATNGTNGDLASPGTGPYIIDNTVVVPPTTDVSMGTTLSFDDSNDRYVYSFIHYDDSGYEVTIEGPNPVPSLNNRTFVISNVCQYPVVAFDPEILPSLPKNAADIVLGLEEENGLPADPMEPSVFTINGAEGPNFPVIDSMPLQNYTITGSYKALFETNEGGTLASPANPGCRTNIDTMTFIRDSEITNDSCICSDNVIVTMERDCSFEVPLNLLVGDDCVGMGVLVDDMNPSNGNTIDCPGTYNYAIFDGNQSALCWGTITAEDKTGPTITLVLPDTVINEFDCAQTETLVNNEETTMPIITNFFGQSENDRFLGYAIATDACGSCGCGTTIDFSDVVEYYDCDSTILTGTTGRMIRTWTARDCNGYSSQLQQIFRIFRPSLDDLTSRRDQTVQACDLDSVGRISVSVPAWENAFNSSTSLSDVCGYGLSINDGPIAEVCNGTGYKFERIYTVIDWCTGELRNLDTIIVKVGDFEAPVFGDCAFTQEQSDSIGGIASQFFAGLTIDQLVDSLNDGNFTVDTVLNMPFEVTEKEVSSGPMDCTAALDLSIEGLRATFGNDLVSDCEDPTVTVSIISYVPVLVGKVPTGDYEWVVGDYGTQGEMAVGMPAGRHAAIINANDACYNASKAVVFFEVKDLSKPVMKCDDELRITLVDGDAKLGINGYAQASYEDVDEGSWDNCELVDLQVRRLVDNTSGAADDYEKKYGADYREDYIEETGYSKWDDIVEFFCADLNAPVEVQLRGTDASGNVSTCWLNIDLENGLNYQVLLDGGGWITCQEAVTQENVYDFITIDQLGIQCAGPEVGVTITPQLDQCGVGRYAIALDVSGGDNKNNNYVDPDPVYVEVYAVHDYWVKFPADEAYDCGEDTDISGVEVSEDVACDLLAVSSTDERFNATDDPDACYKIFRTYRVINWCEYDSEALPVIVSRDWDAHNPNNFCDLNDDDDEEDVGEYFLNPDKPDGDGNPGDEDLYVIVEVDDHDSTGIVYYDNDADPTNLSTADDDYEYAGYWWAVTRELDCVDESTWEDGLDDVSQGSPAQDDDDNRYGSHGFWQYTQHIVVYDDSDPVAVIDAPDTGSENNFDCSANTNFTITITDACSIEDITTTVYVNGANEDANATTTVNGDTIVVTVSERRVIDNYKVKVVVNDGCGNIIEEEAEFDVFDDKAPAPICHEDMVVELSPVEGGGAAAVIWASDFIASPIGDCSGQSDSEVSVGNGTFQPMVTQFSINRLDSAAIDTITGITFTCEDAGGLVEVEVHAWDAVGNNDFCVTTVLVQDNNASCEQDASSGLIAGAINTEDQKPVEDVEVNLSGNIAKKVMTNIQGEFGFNRLEQGHDYSVTPMKDDNHRNGISTFDLIVIQKHILGTALLDSPYKMIAADVNNSKSVTTLDLIQLRKLILNIDVEFENNTSWRFVDASYTFPNASNPWASSFPEIKNINNLSEEDFATFVAIKVGDVNGSALVDAREAKGMFTVTTPEMDLVTGNEYRVDFKADMSEIEGYQFTLALDGADMVELIDGAATAEHFGVFTQEGVITTSFNKGTEDVQPQLFSLIIRATRDAKLSEVLTMNSRYTAAEAYTRVQGDLLDVRLAIDGAVALDSEFELIQNTPNPFKGETVIGFHLPEAGEATITLQDIAGKTIKVIEGDFAKGYNQISLKATDLPSTGVFFYTLTLGDLTATKKMITVE